MENNKTNYFATMTRRTLAAVTVAVCLAQPVSAGIVLENLTQSGLDAVHKDLANLTLFSTGSSGAPIGSPFGVELGVIGGVGTRNNINKQRGVSSEDTLIPVLPVGFITLAVSVPGAITLEGNWRPRFAWAGFSSEAYGGGARWTFTRLLPITPLVADIGLNYSFGNFNYDQTVSGIGSNVNMDRYILGYGTTVGLDLDWFRPYVYLGYAKSDMVIAATNASTVFNTSLSTNNSANSAVGSWVGRAGFELVFPLGSVGLEYQRAFDGDRVTLKTSGRFP